MTATTADNVQETSTTTGTGNFTVASVNGRRRFSSAFGTGSTTDIFFYFISNVSPHSSEWEIGTGHCSDANTLVRDTVLESSNSNAKVNFTNGTKLVCSDIPASYQLNTTQVTNVKMFGAKGDGREVGTAFSITSGTNMLTVTGGDFTSDDEGKIIVVTGAGAAGINLVSTIASVTSSTVVNLAANAGTTRSAVSGTVLVGTDDRAAIQAAIDFAVTAGGTAKANKAVKLQMDMGDFLIGDELVVTTTEPVESVNFEICGQGGGTRTSNVANANRSPTRIMWAGNQTVNNAKYVIKFESSSASFSHSRSNVLRDLAIDGGDVVSGILLDESAYFRRYDVAIHRCRYSVHGPDGTFGYLSISGEDWNYSEKGVWLENDAHNVVFFDVRMGTDTGYKPTRSIQVGTAGSSNNLTILGGEIEPFGTAVIDSIERIGIDFAQGRCFTCHGLHFEEPSGTNLDYFIRLGNTGNGTYVDGASIEGCQFPKATDGPLYLAGTQYGIDAQGIRGGKVAGNYYSNITGTLVKLGTVNDLDIGPNYRDGLSSDGARLYITTGGNVLQLSRLSTDGALLRGGLAGANDVEIGTASGAAYLKVTRAASVLQLIGTAGAGADIGTSGNLRPLTDNVEALGTTTREWADLFLGSGAVINFNNGDVTVTHSSNALTWAGATSYTFDVAPNVGGSTVATLGVEDQTLAGGAKITEKDLGTISSGTVTPDPGARPMQIYTNNGAHTLAPHATNFGHYALKVTNGASAGAVTTSGWTKVIGAFDTTSGHKFDCQCRIWSDGTSILSIQEAF